MRNLGEVKKGDSILEVMKTLSSLGKDEIGVVTAGKANFQICYLPSEGGKSSRKLEAINFHNPSDKKVGELAEIAIFLCDKVY